MKLKLILLLVLILLFGGFIVVRFFLVNNQNVTGKIKIVSSPTAGIFLNNLAIGKTPFENSYKIGDYILKLIPEGSATDTASWQGKIAIYKNSLTYVNRELGLSDLTSAGEIFTTKKMERQSSNPNLGEIYVETEPQGAIVYLDNDEKGVAPLLLSEVLKGEHELSVSMPGFLRRTQKINIDSGYQVNAQFKLSIDQLQKTEATEEAKMKKSDEVKKEEAESPEAKKTLVVIKDTPTGFLRVRADASIEATEEAQVKPGDKFELLEEKNGWYEINYEADKTGWVYSQYAEKQEQ